MNKKLEIRDSVIHSIPEKDLREFVFEKFEDVKKSNKIKDLISFHTTNKFMLMSHDQEKLKKLGHVVADYKKGQLSETVIEYEKHLRDALEKEPTIKTHCNVIMHIFGYFSKNFSQSEKELFFDLLKQFQEEKITLGRLLSEINPIIFRFNSTYLASQTYFLLYSDQEEGNLFKILAKDNI
ncbi:MAG: YbgA family protein [Nitrosopumilus sp.]|nr:YbgA family protein [Nitrosopumilus sp.]